MDVIVINVCAVCVAFLSPVWYYLEEKRAYKTIKDLMLQMTTEL